MTKNQQVMDVADQRIISVSYKLHAGDQQGQLVEEVSKEEPLRFLYGGGNLLQAFEQNVQGLNEGDPFDFTIPSDEAYGPYREDAVIELPYDAFRVEGELREDLLKVGTRVPMQDSEGNSLEGKVKELKDENVEMDFNHPLAGQDLHFAGEVVSVREATDSEKEAGVPQDGESA
ncbi:MAG: peptidylprolyl isomerase [Flavobacteriales bacterium]